MLIKHGWIDIAHLLRRHYDADPTHTYVRNVYNTHTTLSQAEYLTVPGYVYGPCVYARACGWVGWVGGCYVNEG